MTTLVRNPAKRGKFIVLYAPNNLGKSTQLKLLAQKMYGSAHATLVLKYPIYSLKPTGPKINAALRFGKLTSELDLQKIYAKNRRDFQEQLIKLLNCGVNVIAEDYTGTGVAWAMTQNVSLATMEKVNKGLIKPDLAILLDGERFKQAVENGHRNEDAGQEKWEKCRQIHKILAKRYGWKVINANNTIENIETTIWKLVSTLL